MHLVGTGSGSRDFSETSVSSVEPFNRAASPNGGSDWVLTGNSTFPPNSDNVKRMAKENFRSGFAAFIGRPNAGKSTLLNRLVGEKIAAVSNKPQTTRHKIQGIVTRGDGQIVFVDTPGVHKPGHLLNRRMMSAVHDAILSVDLLVLMRDASVSTGNGPMPNMPEFAKAWGCKAPTKMIRQKVCEVW